MVRSIAEEKGKKHQKESSVRMEDRSIPEVNVIVSIT